MLRGALLAIGLLLANLQALAEVQTPNCMGCHAASSDKPVLAIMHTAHGQLGAGNEACTSCHGDSLEHAANPASEPPTLSYGPRWALPAAESTAACLQCHQKGEQMFWMGSVHDQEELTCANCHTTHSNRDAALDGDSQLEVCLGCHTRQQAELRLPSRHPILEGKTTCVDCHNPHGASTEASLKQPTLNDTCYSCHQEKRGPYLWAHAPVDEDCSLCHRAHGSVNDRLLSSRTPFLCQQCHSAAFHPSQLNSGSAANSGSTNMYLLGKNCMNCHGQIHGSNHPSGARLIR